MQVARFQCFHKSTPGHSTIQACDSVFCYRSFGSGRFESGGHCEAGFAACLLGPIPSVCDSYSLAPISEPTTCGWSRILPEIPIPYDSGSTSSDIMRRLGVWRSRSCLTLDGTTAGRLQV